MYCTADLPRRARAQDGASIKLEEDPGAGFEAFRMEAMQYCDGISDNVTRRYAERYAAALLQKARNLEFEEPRKSGLFEPNRNLIRAALQASYRKYFSRDRLQNQPARMAGEEEGE